MFMLLHLAYGTYFLLLVVSTIILGISHRRIQAYISFDPKSINLLLPLIVNFLLANTVFYRISPILTMILPGCICYFISKKLQNVRIFGLTGGVATGKSMLLRMINSRLKHLQVINCERIMIEQMKKGRAGYQKIINLFGKDSQKFLDLQTRQIQQQKLLDFIYQNPINLTKFHSTASGIYFWAVIKTIVKNIIVKKSYIMLISSAYLLQSPFLKFICYPVVLIDSLERLKIQRACKKWNCSEQQTKMRLKLQASLKFNKKKIEECIENNNTQQELLQDFLIKINPHLRKKGQVKHAKH